MSASADLQNAVAACLRRPGCLRAPVEILCRRTKELPNDLEAAAVNDGLCLQVLPVLPLRALQGVPFVFFEAAEVRVRIAEQPALNESGADAYDLVDDVANALQGEPQRTLQAALADRRAAAGEDLPTATAWVEAQPELAGLVELGRLLTQPLELALRPVELKDDPALRVLDVLFIATYGLVPA